MVYEMSGRPEDCFDSDIKGSCEFREELGEEFDEELGEDSYMIIDSLSNGNDLSCRSNRERLSVIPGFIKDIVCSVGLGGLVDNDVWSEGYFQSFNNLFKILHQVAPKRWEVLAAQVIGKEEERFIRCDDKFILDVLSIPSFVRLMEVLGLTFSQVKEMLIYDEELHGVQKEDVVLLKLTVFDYDVAGDDNENDREYLYDIYDELQHQKAFNLLM